MQSNSVFPMLWERRLRPVSFPRAAKSVPRVGRGGAGGCWLHKEKKVYLKFDVDSIQVLGKIGS